MRPYREYGLKSGLVSLVCLWLAATGFLLAAPTHAEACDIDDDLAAAAAESLRDGEAVAIGQATDSMSCELLVSGPHIRVTARRPPTPADIARANEIRARIRQGLGKYEDWRAAERDGYYDRHPDLPKQIYHFSNPANVEASYHGEPFDPLRPASFLYERTTAGYKLVGVMYVAPQRTSEADLDARVPVSVAPWHLHTNVCLPGRGRWQVPDWRRFGPTGSIATAGACMAAGGRFVPVMFGWMTHLDLHDAPQPVSALPSPPVAAAKIDGRYAGQVCYGPNPTGDPARCYRANATVHDGTLVGEWPGRDGLTVKLAGEVSTTGDVKIAMQAERPDGREVARANLSGTIQDGHLHARGTFLNGRTIALDWERQLGGSDETGGGPPKLGAGKQ